MYRKSLKELKSLIKKDIETCKNFTENESIRKDQNPQIVEMRIKDESRIETLEDVLRYIESGEKFWFRKD